MRFAAEIVRGKKPPEALRSASELLDAQVADKMDDKTLLSHIKRWFETAHDRCIWPVRERISRLVAVRLGRARGI